MHLPQKTRITNALFTPSGCFEHLLLDPFHVHHPQCLLEKDWFWCGPPGSGQNSGSFGAKIPQVLPMGLLLSFLPGITHLNGSLYDQAKYSLIYLPSWVRAMTNHSIHTKKDLWNNTHFLHKQILVGWLTKDPFYIFKCVALVVLG